jgi:hypothetical protein
MTRPPEWKTILAVALAFVVCFQVLVVFSGVAQATQGTKTSPCAC